MDLQEVAATVVAQHLRTLRPDPVAFNRLARRTLTPEEHEELIGRIARLAAALAEHVERAGLVAGRS